MSVLRLTRAVYHALCARGEQSWPHECCGALLGKSTLEGWLVQAAIPAQNACTGSAHSRYKIAPAELVKIEREARRQGFEIAGFYHSHPGSAAHWSSADLAEAHWLGCSYLITAVAEGKATVTKAFRLTGLSAQDKRFEEETIQVDDVGSRSEPSPPLHSE